MESLDQPQDTMLDTPQDRIVKCLKHISRDSAWKTDVRYIIESNFKEETPFEIRKAIYGAYAKIHCERTEFVSDLIEKQNALLKSVVGIPFRLEFVLIETLACELGALTLIEFEPNEPLAQLAIRCVVGSLSEHGFGQLLAFNAINHWEQTTAKEKISHQLMLYLRGYTQIYLD
jgi:hypothetical protein